MKKEANAFQRGLLNGCDVEASQRGSVRLCLKSNARRYPLCFLIASIGFYLRIVKLIGSHSDYTMDNEPAFLADSL